MSASHALLAALSCCLCLMETARAQATMDSTSWRREGGGMLGYGRYDFVDSHGSFIGGGRFGWRLGGRTLLDLSLVSITAQSSTGQDSFGFNGDVGLAVDIDRMHLSPIAGVGAGFALASGDAPDGLALHALVGARYRFKPNWSFRLDTKFRSIDGGRAKTVEVTLGLNKRR